MTNFEKYKEDILLDLVKVHAHSFVGKYLGLGCGNSANCDECAEKWVQWLDEEYEVPMNCDHCEYAIQRYSDGKWVMCCRFKTFDEAPVESIKKCPQGEWHPFFGEL